MGDSITAGFGMLGDDIFEEIFEYRGHSFPVGGAEDALTMPNLLRVVIGGAHKIIGPPTRRSLPLDIAHLREHVIVPYHPAVDQLNAAQTLARARRLPQQLEYLLDQMKKNPEIDMQKDWKVITIYIGVRLSLSLPLNSRCLP